MAKKYNEEKQDEKIQKQRIEEAKMIANKSRSIIDSNYSAITRKSSRIFKRINNRLDFLLTNSMSTKIISLLLALFLFITFNYSGDINVFGQSTVGKNLYGIKVKAIYDTNKYQVDNLPETVDLSLVGNIEALRKTELVSNTEVIADLSQYKPGLNQEVQLLYGGIAKGIDVKFSQSIYTVNIYSKETRKFNVGYQLIKVPVDTKYNYQVSIDENIINIKAAKHTLDDIAEVKILVDVSNQKKSFQAKGLLVAYDSEGNKLNDIIFDKQEIAYNVLITTKK